MTIELQVPELGESIEEVRIGDWLKEPGERVAMDEILVEIDSDKATVEFPSPAAGVLKEIRLETGADAKVGEVMAILEEGAGAEGEDEAAAADETPAEEPEAAEEAAAKEPEAAKAEEGDADDGAEAAGGTTAHERAPAVEETPSISPSARKLLREHGIPLEEARRRSGGRVGRAEAQALIDGGGEAAAPAAARREETVRMSPLRRTIAKRLVEAQQTAALLTTFNEIDMTAVKAARKTHGERFQAVHGVKLGFMSFFVRAACEALKAYPGLNARVDGDSIVFRNYMDVGVAVGTERGLVVPVLRNAERLGFADVEKAIGDFAERAGKGRLDPDELTGGTFTISNGGVYGSLLSTPIVNPPQSGVLGLHAIQDRPVGVEGRIELRPMMYVALTYDHRIVDGKEAVSWLRHLKASIEDPTRILFEL